MRGSKHSPVQNSKRFRAPSSLDLFKRAAFGIAPNAHQTIYGHTQNSRENYRPRHRCYHTSAGTRKYRNGSEEGHGHDH